MTQEHQVGPLADELRALASVLADKSQGGAEDLLASIREQLLGGRGEPGDETLVERIDIS